MTEVIRCTCKHEHQDKFYGVQMRLVNKAQKGTIGTCKVFGG